MKTHQEFIENMTEASSKGRYKPIVNRNLEIQSLTEILSQSKRCNPILIGDIGIGCSSIIKGFAKKSKAPTFRIRFDLLLTNPNELLQRLHALLNTIKEKEEKIILVLDELNALSDANQATCQAVVNWIKIILLNRYAKLILVCNYHFYKKNIAQDPYMLKYCMPAAIKEPGNNKTLEIILSHVDAIKHNHSIDIDENCIPKLVELAKRYIPNAVMPTSAIHLLDAAAAKLKTKQQPKPLDVQHVISLLHEWTHIPKEILLKTDAEKIATCDNNLTQSIYGQAYAIQTIKQTLQAGTLRIGNLIPIAKFLFAGPTNSGKKTTALTLAKYFYGNEDHFINFDMANYQQSKSAEQLFGSSNTSDENGDLLPHINKHPFSILLFDNIELAHSNVIYELQNIIEKCQIKGRNLSNTIIIMTTESSFEQKNISSKTNLLQLIANDIPNIDDQSNQIDIENILPIDKLTKQFGTKFFQDLTIIPFFPLENHELINFTGNQLLLLKTRLLKEKQIDLKYSEELAADLLTLLPESKQSIPSIKNYLSQKLHI